MFCRAKSAKNKLFLRGYFRPLHNKNVQFWDHSFPALFPKDSESLKTLDIRLREVGGKIGLKIYYMKRGQINKQTDYSTTRLNRPSGPIRWKHILCIKFKDSFHGPSLKSYWRLLSSIFQNSIFPIPCSAAKDCRNLDGLYILVICLVSWLVGCDAEEYNDQVIHSFSSDRKIIEYAEMPGIGWKRLEYAGICWNTLEYAEKYWKRIE